MTEVREQQNDSIGSRVDAPVGVLPIPSPQDVEKVKPNKKYVCFSDAHDFAQSLELRTRKEWRLYVKGALEGKPEKPDHIPAHPDGIYKVKGWQGWKYWLGTAGRNMLQ